MSKEYGIDAVSAWDITTGSKKVRVGVIDSGIAQHNDLNANVVACWDFYNDDNTARDDVDGHGTHVTGIIGATGNNNLGISGVCQNISLVPLQVYDVNKANGKKIFDSASIINAVIWAAQNDIAILNNSYITSNSFALRSAISNYTGLMVCGAGNDNINNDKNDYFPASYSSGYDFSNRVISVGAISEKDELAFWVGDNVEDLKDKLKGSNYGAENVSIYALGDDILSTIPGNKFAKESGTSMAAPVVSVYRR